MLQLLKSGKKYSINELAEKLEVSPRMIRVYKDELEKAGIYVDSIQGIYGGYVLNQRLSSLDVGLSKEDLALFKSIGEYILDRDDFVFRKEYNDFVIKINSAYENLRNKKAANIPSVPYIQKFLDEKDTKEETKKYNKINYAIKNKRKMKIKYASLNSGMIDRIIHPCGLFVHEDYWYLSAYCELKGQTRSFVVSRIIEYEILNEIFK